jgi:hypothetical protein
MCNFRGSITSRRFPEAAATQLPHMQFVFKDSGSFTTIDFPSCGLSHHSSVGTKLTDLIGVVFAPPTCYLPFCPIILFCDALGIAVGAFGRLALLSATEPVQDHAHSQVHALINMSGPDTGYRVDGQSALLTDGQMILVNPWVVHSNARQVCIEPTILPAL